MPERKTEVVPTALLIRAEQHKKSFLFLLEEKIGRAQIRKCKENFFMGRAGFRHGGGMVSFGVLLKVGSSKVQNFPPASQKDFLERKSFCLLKNKC